MGVLHRPPPHVLGGAFTLNRASPLTNGLLYSRLHQTELTRNSFTTTTHGTGVTQKPSQFGVVDYYPGSSGAIRKVSNDTVFNNAAKGLTVHVRLYDPNPNADNIFNNRHTVNRDGDAYGGPRCWILRKEDDTSVRWHTWWSDDVLTTYNPASSWTVNRWFDIVCTSWIDASGGNMAVYMDGLLVGSTTEAGKTAIKTGSGSPIQIGGNNDSGGAHEQFIECVNIWGRALTASEVVDLQLRPYSLYRPNWQQDEADTVAAASYAFPVVSGVSRHIFRRAAPVAGVSA